MDGERTRSASDVWAAATEETPNLPAVRPPSPVAVRPPTDLPGVALQTVLGLVDALVTALERALGRTDGPLRSAGDVALGAAWQGYRVSVRLAGGAATAAAPVARLVVDPPFVPTALRLRTLAAGAAGTWQAERPAAQHRAGAARDALVPDVVDAVLEPIDLTSLVLQRVDLEPIVTAALDRLDLTQVVLDRVELGQVVLDAMDRLDLTQVVVDRVDLDRVVTTVLDGMDLTALVRERVDLVGIAEEVIDAVDLPEIIRASTGSVASETVRSVRMQSIGADEGVQRLVDRVILWRRGRETQAPGQVEEAELPPSDAELPPADAPSADDGDSPR